jgi:hypothetical protein
MTRAAQEIGELARQMLRLAPAAGLRVGIKIEPAQGIEAATADETRSGSAVGESPVGEADAPKGDPA